MRVCWWAVPTLPLGRRTAYSSPLRGEVRWGWQKEFEEIFPKAVNN